MKDCTLRARRSLAVTAALLTVTLHAPALDLDQDKVTFATNGKAQAAHGGFYQAVNAMMLQDNPEMSMVELEDSVALMTAQVIVDSGEAASKDIGAMNAASIKDFHEPTVKAGLYKPGEVDLARVATLQFFNEGAGQDLKARLVDR